MSDEPQLDNHTDSTHPTAAGTKSSTVAWVGRNQQPSAPHYGAGALLLGCGLFEPAEVAAQDWHVTGVDNGRHVKAMITTLLQEVEIPLDEIEPLCRNNPGRLNTDLVELKRVAAGVQRLQDRCGLPDSWQALAQERVLRYPEKLCKRIQYLCEDALTLGSGTLAFQNDQFDLITVNNLITQFRKQGAGKDKLVRFFSECKRLLSPLGRLNVQTTLDSFLSIHGSSHPFYLMDVMNDSGLSPKTIVATDLVVSRGKIRGSYSMSTDNSCQAHGMEEQVMSRGIEVKKWTVDNEAQMRLLWRDFGKETIPLVMTREPTGRWNLLIANMADVKERLQNPMGLEHDRNFYQYDMFDHLVGEMKTE